ncbi:MAG: hypothetical protein JWO03_3947 [Bacteroidetes bacterium]|nr:hypothetical protein [Bacteroidota bacterium]
MAYRLTQEELKKYRLEESDMPEIWARFDQWKERSHDDTGEDRTLSGEVLRWQESQLAREEDQIAWEREMELLRLDDQIQEEEIENIK